MSKRALQATKQYYAYCESRRKLHNNNLGMQGTWPNQTKHDNNKCGHNLVSATHKVSNHHLPCE